MATPQATDKTIRRSLFDHAARPVYTLRFRAAAPGAPGTARPGECLMSNSHTPEDSA